MCFIVFPEAKGTKKKIKHAEKPAEPHDGKNNLILVFRVIGKTNVLPWIFAYSHENM